MKEEDKQIIEKELDEILEKFNEGNFTAQQFMNYSRILKQTLLQNLGLHRKQRECIFPDCSKQSIKRSHSIPKTTTLLHIASNGHILKPEFDFTSHNVPQIEMQKLGISSASVFPGFCKKHENIFETFEQNGKIDNERKALLQTYRAVCRERVFREIEIEINEINKAAYQEKINKEALFIINNSLSAQNNLSNIKSIEFKGVDSIIYSLEGLSLYHNDTNIELLEIENKIFTSIYKPTKRNDLIIEVANIDIKFPISLCGFATINYNENSDERIAYILLNILPQKDSTTIVCVGLEKDKNICKKYFDYSLSDPLTILNMIESFMINGTDHWFINPDFWSKISTKKQKKILHDILITEDSIIDEYPISIFDDLRKKIISVLKKNIQNRQLKKNEKERIKIEMQKLENNDFNIVFDENKFNERMDNKIKH